MSESGGGSSAVSDWIPEARLDDGAGAESRPPPRGGTPDPPAGRTRTAWRRRTAIAAAALGTAVLVGTVVALLAGSDMGRRVATASEAGGRSEPADGFFQRSSEASGLAEAPPQEARVPVVSRLTNLSPSEASLLAGMATLRDERAAARAAGKDTPAVSALSQVPHASSVRYEYLRRVGAVGVVLAGLDKLDIQPARAGTTDRPTSRERRQLDRLLIITARLTLGPYPQDQRLSDLVTAAVLQLSPLTAGDLKPRRSARLRRVNRRLSGLGRSIVRDLDRAAESMVAGNPGSAGRLLAAVDRTLKRIAPAS